MSATGLEVFDKTLQTTNIWLEDIEAKLGPDRRLAWKVLSTVLHKLRDRMPVELSAHFSAELPLLVRGAYYDQFQPSKQPSDWDLDSFIEEVSKQLSDVRPVNARDATQAVFAALSRRIPEGQIEKVQNALPKDLRAFWIAAEERVVSPPNGAKSNAGTSEAS